MSSCCKCHKVGTHKPSVSDETHYCQTCWVNVKCKQCQIICALVSLHDTVGIPRIPTGQGFEFMDHFESMSEAIASFSALLKTDKYLKKEIIGYGLIFSDIGTVKLFHYTAKSLEK